MPRWVAAWASTSAKVRSSDSLRPSPGEGEHFLDTGVLARGRRRVYFDFVTELAAGFAGAEVKAGELEIAEGESEVIGELRTTPTCVPR
jgi:hypothetical protein